MKQLCVFCSSSSAISLDYLKKAREIATIFAKNGFNLVFGAGSVGLMREVALVFSENKREITGVVPEKIYNKMEIFNKIDNLIITKDLSERIDTMIEKSNAFLILPGGFGTLQELINVITLKQLDYIDKPIVIYNYKNFYYYLLKQFEQIFKNYFAKEIYNELYFVSDDEQKIYEYILNYKYFNIKEEKWFC